MMQKLDLDGASASNQVQSGDIWLAAAGSASYSALRIIRLKTGRSGTELQIAGRERCTLRSHEMEKKRKNEDEYR
jgi:hypothetical protein